MENSCAEYIASNFSDLMKSNKLNHLPPDLWTKFIQVNFYIFYLKFIIIIIYYYFILFYFILSYLIINYLILLIFIILYSILILLFSLY